MRKKVNIFLISDNIESVSSVRKKLKKVELNFNLKTVNTQKNFQKQLSIFKPDIIINDRCNTFDEVTTLKIINKHNSHIPFIYISGLLDLVHIINLIKNNTGNIILRKDLDWLGASITSALKINEKQKNKLTLEEELKRRNIFIETVLKNLPIGLAVNTINDGKLQCMNSKFEEIYGWPKDILNGVDSFFKHVYPDSKYRKQIKEKVLSDINSGDPKRMIWENIKVTTKDGKQKIVTAINIPLPEQNLMISTVQDVTTQWEAKEKIKESENRFQSALKNSPIILAHTDKKLHYKWICNPHSDFKDKQIIGKRDDELDSSNGAKELLKLKRRVLKSKKGERKEITFEFSNAKVVYDITAEPLKNSSGEIIGVNTVALDITKRKIAQEQINMLAHAIKSISECVSITDMNDKILFVNEAFLKTYKFKRNELIGKSIKVIRANNNVKNHILTSTIKGGWEGELWNKKKDGTVFPIMLNTSVIRDDNGKPVALIGVAKDISIQKKSDKALRESEERYRNLVNSAPVCIGIHQGGRWIMVNQATLDLFGFKNGELLGKPIVNILHPDSREFALKRIQTMLETGKPVPLTEEKLLKKDGSVIYVLVSSTPINYQGEVAFQVTAVDITERKQTTELLSESEIKYKSLFEAANDAIFLMEGEQFVDCNSKTLLMYGCKRSEIIGQTPFKFSPDKQTDGQFSREKGLEKIGKALKGEPQFFEWKHSRLDGSLFDVEVGLSGIEIKGKKYIQAIVRDITERKKTEEEVIRRTKQIIRNQNALLDLANINHFDFESAIKKICEVDSKTLGVERVSVWFFNKEYSEIECNNLFIHSKKSHEQGLKLPIGQKKRYYKALEANRNIAANDAQNDPRTNEFSEEYLIPNGITSMMDVPIRSYGKIVGVVCHEHLGPKRQWTLEDQDFAGSIADIVSIALESFRRKQTEMALRESEAKYRNIFEQSKDIIFISTPDDKIIDINPAGVELLGYSNKEELLNINISKELYFDPSARKNFKDQLDNEGFVKDYQATLKSKDGREIIVLETVTTDRDNNGNITAYRGIMRDVTEQKRLEKQLLHAQKMEAMGTLAGGIAHDFNNILSAILGYTEITKNESKEGTRTYKNLEQIYKAGIRAKELVAQILTFSRKTEQESKPVKIENIIKEVLKLLRASLPVTIDIRENIEENCGVVLGDPTQIHQIIMNLCTNAYDAMRETGGVLEINLSAVNSEKAFYEENQTLREGDYLKLTVRDTGHGMEPQVIQRIFDPFFTTKSPGSGTGMGLSVVHGIVNSHKGTITVSSEENKGSIFNVYLPRHDNSTYVEQEMSETFPLGRERILLIDDEEAIVQTSKEILEKLGYSVTATTSSNEALELFQTNSKEFDLVITDQTMPKLTGADLAKELMSIQPKIPVILITGYSELVTPEKAKLMGIREYIRKPVSTFYLAKKIRSVLDDQKN